jgi:hypothetical protein
MVVCWASARSRSRSAVLRSTRIRTVLVMHTQ